MISLSEVHLEERYIVVDVGITYSDDDIEPKPEKTKTTMLYMLIYCFLPPWSLLLDESCPVVDLTG